MTHSGARAAAKVFGLAWNLADHITDDLAKVLADAVEQAVKERDYMVQKVECLRVQSDARAEEIARLKDGLSEVCTRHGCVYELPDIHERCEEDKRQQAEEIAAQSHMQEEQERITLAWQSRCREQVEEIARLRKVVTLDAAKDRELARFVMEQSEEIVRTEGKRRHLANAYEQEFGKRIAAEEELARLRAELEAQLDSEHGAHAMAERLCIQHAKELQAAVAAERQVCIEIAVGVANKYPSWAEDHQIGALDVAAALRAPTPAPPAGEDAG